MGFLKGLFRSLKSIILPLALGFGLAALGPAGGFLAKFGMAIGTSVGGFLFGRQKPPEAPLADITQPKSEYDSGIPVCFGSVRLPAIFIDGDPRGCIREIKTSRETKRTFTGAILWCEGAENPKQIKKIWANDNVIFDVAGATPAAKGFVLAAQGDGSQHGQHHSNGTQKLRNYPGNYKQLPDPKLVAIHGAGKVPGYRGCCYSMLEELSLETWEYSLPNFRALVVDTVTGAQQIVTALAVRVGIPPEQLSLAPLAGKTVRLLVTTQPVEAKSLVEDVCNWHFVDLVDCNARLEASDRKNPKVWEIDEGELGAHDQGEELPARVQVRADQVRALPSIASLRFIDVERDWEVNSASAILQNGRHEGENEKGFEIAVGATYAEASNWIKPALDEAHAGRFPVEVSVPFRRLAIGPGDVLLLPLEGDTLQVRVTGQTAALPGPIGCQCVSYDAEVYAGHRLANPPAARPPGAVRTFPAPSVVLIDSVALRDDDADIRGPVLYAAMSRPDPPTAAELGSFATGYGPWSGGSLAFVPKLSSNDPTYIDFEEQATVGTAFSVLTVGEDLTQPRTLDFSQTLTVDIEGGGPLQSVSQAQVLAGANRAFLQSGTNWELLAWQTATLDEAGSPENKKRYVLSGLLRGLRGTEIFRGAHVAGSIFVRADDAVRRLPIELGRVNAGTSWTASLGSAGASGLFTPRGLNMKPLAPTELDAVQDEAGAWLVTWQARDRRSEIMGAPASDGGLRFRVTFYQAGGAVLEDYDVLNVSEFSLTPALQTAHMGGPQSTIRVAVQQISSVTPGTMGLGWPTPITVFTSD